MTLSTALAAGRAAAEARMVDTCIIDRVSGEFTDLATGVVTKTYTVLYDGKCEIQQHQAQARPETVGEAYVLMLMLMVKLPMSVTGLQPDDRVTITASRHDPDLVGRTLLIRDIFHKTHATARRITVQERTS